MARLFEWHRSLQEFSALESFFLDLFPIPIAEGVTLERVVVTGAADSIDNNDSVARGRRYAFAVEVTSGDPGAGGPPLPERLLDSSIPLGDRDFLHLEMTTWTTQQSLNTNHAVLPFDGAWGVDTSTRRTPAAGQAIMPWWVFDQDFTSGTGWNHMVGISTLISFPE